eukprot:SAG31_NODE_4244_length_3423_cov_1.807461_1_plen_97_part_10
MGNLGRAVFGRSNDGMWPYSSPSECPRTKLDQAINSASGQRVGSCSSFEEPSELHALKMPLRKPRGAPEIDIVEATPGDNSLRLQHGQESMCKTKAH